MAIQYLPSFWDQLGQGLSRFGDSYQHNKELAMQERDRKLNNIIALFGAGATDSGSLSAALKASGQGDIPIMKSQAERRNDLLSPAPPISVPTGVTGVSGALQPANINLNKGAFAGEDERFAAGLPSVADVQTKTAESKIAMGKAAAQPAALARAETGESDKLFEGAADRFVSGELGQYGRISPKMRNKVVEAAFQRYKATRANSKMGLIPDEAYAREFFNKAFDDALHQQTQEDISMRLAGGRATEADRTFSQLTAALNENRQRMANLESSDRLLTFKIRNARYANDPAVLQYRKLQASANSIRDAMSKVADPRVQSDIAATGSAGEGAPPPAAAAPAAAPAAPTFNERVNQAVELLKSTPPDQADKFIDAKVGTLLTKDEADEIKKRVRAAAVNKAKVRQQIDTNRMPPL